MSAVKGGDKFAAKFNAIVATLQPSRVRVGFLEGATYPARPRRALRAAYRKRQAKGIQTPIKGSDASINVASVAFFQEYGTKTIPPRPFFRTMIRIKSPEWGPALAYQLRNNGFDAQKALAVLGEGIAGQLRESVINTNSPPLRPSTIAAKGFAKPLIDTAHMLMSIDYEIRRG